jgi:hypothetical protein
MTAQASGFLGATLVIGAFLLRDPRRIMAASFASSLLWILHFGLMGAWAGLIVSCASALRNAAGAWMRDRAMILVTWTAAAFVVGFGLLFDSAGLVILLTAPIRAIANHLRDREIAFRLVCALSGLCYITYGLMIGSPLWVSSLLALGVVVATAARRALKGRRLAA